MRCFSSAGLTYDVFYRVAWSFGGVFTFLVDCVSGGFLIVDFMLGSDQAVSVICRQRFGGQLVREIKLRGGFPSLRSADVQE